MSANNFILIRKKKDGNFLVQHCDADTGHEIESLGVFKNLEQASKTANNFIDENEVEYGIKINI